MIRDWFKVADEDGTLDAAAGVIPETVELPEANTSMDASSWTT